MPFTDPAEAIAYKKRYWAANRTEITRKKRAHYHANRPLYIARARRAHLARAYGITEAEYAAMLEAQAGLCAICLKPPKTKRLGVDHNHKTGAVRGLLCPRCNSMLGRMQENAEAFERAGHYLRAFEVVTLDEL